MKIVVGGIYLYQIDILESGNKSPPWCHARGGAGMGGDYHKKLKQNSEMIIITINKNDIFNIFSFLILE